eukprot:jgi/Mesvir1/2850/Mv13936-RA.1
MVRSRDNKSSKVGSIDEKVASAFKPILGPLSNVCCNKFSTSSVGGLLAILVAAVALSFALGYAVTLGFSYRTASSSYASVPKVEVHDDPAVWEECENRLREAQVGFFMGHACLFNVSRKADWVATRMFFDAQEGAEESQTTEEGEQPSCAFINLGVRGGEWLRNWKETGALDACYSFTYAQPKALDPLKQATSGFQKFFVRPMWKPGTHTLDGEFAKINAAVPDGTVFVKINVPDYEANHLQGFSEGLSSGRVGAVVWERDVLNAKGRSLQDEVEFVSRYGYHVYLASVHGDPSGEDDGLQPGAFLRLDGNHWDSSFASMHAPLVMTLLAVKETHPLAHELDTQHSLCPVVASYGGPTCSCVMERFGRVNHTCTLASLVMRSAQEVDSSVTEAQEAARQAAAQAREALRAAEAQRERAKKAIELQQSAQKALELHREKTRKAEDDAQKAIERAQATEVRQKEMEATQRYWQSKHDQLQATIRELEKRHAANQAVAALGVPQLHRTSTLQRATTTPVTHASDIPRDAHGHIKKPPTRRRGKGRGL